MVFIGIGPTGNPDLASGRETGDGVQKNGGVTSQGVPGNGYLRPCKAGGLPSGPAPCFCAGRQADNSG